MSEHNPVWPYSERDSSQAQASVDVLLATPEVQLSDLERQEAYAFARELFVGRPTEAGEVQTLQDVNLINVDAGEQTFYANYFHANEDAENEQDRVGPLALRKLGLSPGQDDASIRQELYAAVATDTSVDKSVSREVANASRKWYIGQVAAQLAQAETSSDFVDSQAISVRFAPDTLLDKFAALQRFRSFYREVSTSLAAEEPSPVQQAKQVLLRVHWATVNSEIAELYPAMLNLVEQLAASPATERTDRWRAQLMASAPVLRAALQNAGRSDLSVFSDDFARRMDLIRNGTQATDEHNFSPVNVALQELAGTLDGQDRNGEQMPPSQLPAEILERLDETTWGPEEFQVLLEGVLSKWDLLSSERSDWQAVLDRTGPASDGKWQIVITPKVQSLSVNGKKKTMSIPLEFMRSLTNVDARPPGALAVAAHELVHVLQNESDEVLAQSIPLAKVKGRRNLLLRELGGINEETITQAICGRMRPTNTAYLRGLQAKLAGANQAEVARACQTAANKTDVTENDRKRTADSMLRFYRSKGHNSQPVNYVEQELVRLSMQDVPVDQVRALVTAGSSFSIVDTAELHRVGLFELPQTVDHRPTEDVLEVLQALHPELFDSARTN